MVELSLPHQPFQYGAELFEVQSSRPDALSHALYSSFSQDRAALSLVRGGMDTVAFYEAHPSFRPPTEDTRSRPSSFKDGGVKREDLGVTHVNLKRFEEALDESVNGLKAARNMASALLEDTIDRPEEPELLLGVREIKYGVHRSIGWHIDDTTTIGAASIDMTPPDLVEPNQPVAEVMAVKLHPSLPRRSLSTTEHFIDRWTKIPLKESEIDEEGIAVARTEIYPGDIVFFPFGSAHSVKALVPERSAAVLATHVTRMTPSLMLMSNKIRFDRSANNL